MASQSSSYFILFGAIMINFLISFLVYSLILYSNIIRVLNDDLASYQSTELIY